MKDFTSYLNSPKFWQGVALIAIGLLVLSQLFTIRITPRFSIPGVLSKNSTTSEIVSTSSERVDVAGIREQVTPTEGVVLAIQWNDLGQKMIADGVIDEQKFRDIFPEGFDEQEEAMLTGSVNKPVIMNADNSRFFLDILWAFGLANKNDILENGEMTDEQYGGAGNFASTGGWSLSKGDAMNHYSHHHYVNLTPEQQALVDEVSRGIFRPCCGNSTHFPDCNHGMAMLGLLQLMAANGATEQEMYDAALLVNSYWFPQTYTDLATYFQEQGTEWKDIDAQLVLGADFSSSRGYQETRAKIQSLPQPVNGGGGCGV